MSKLSFADLFCGVGGMSLGLKDAGFEHTVSTDIWNAAERNYKSYVSEDAFIKLDISNNEDRETLITTLKKENPFLLAGGPPCQGFSTLGKRKSNDERNSLVDAFLEIIKETQPNAIIMENVSGLKSMAHKSGVKYPVFIKEFLKSLPANYQVCEIQLEGTDFGLAQTRKRVFFVGVKKDLLKDEYQDLDFSAIFNETLNRYKVVEKKVLKDVIFDLPRLESEEGEEEIEDKGIRIYNHNVFKYSDLLLKRLSFVKYGGGLQDIPQEYLSDHLKKMVNGEYGSGGFVKNIYGRLEWEKPSGTVVAGIRKITCGRFVHPENNRLLTVRECARLQGFPDEYKFTGSMTEQYTLVGNAVPPNFSKVLGVTLQDLIKNI